MCPSPCLRFHSVIIAANGENREPCGGGNVNKRWVKENISYSGFKSIIARKKYVNYCEDLTVDYYSVNVRDLTMEVNPEKV